MKPAESLDELKRQMCSKMMSPMKNEISRYIENKLHNSANQNAVGEFSRASGGIGDITMLETEIHNSGDSIDLTIKNIAPPQPSIFDTPISEYPGMFSEWIEYGEWLDVVHYMDTGEKVKRPARPFFEPVEQELAADPSVLEGFIKKSLE